MVQLPEPVSARVVALHALTPTVQEVRLRVEDGADIGFRCGQWIDLFIPGIDTIGGFSICSTPEELPELSLAVKRSRHPPAHWLHASAKVGDCVALRVGGSFAHDVASDPDRLTRDVVLVGGGIGVSPLRSIFRQWVSWRGSSLEGRSASSRLVLLASARSASELAFRDEYMQAQADLGPTALAVHLTVSRDDDTPMSDTATTLMMPMLPRRAGDESVFDAGVIHRGRVLRELPRVAALVESSSSVSASSSVSSTSIPGPLWFVCGPPAMIDDVARHLTSDLGVDASRVRFERWW